MTPTLSMFGSNTRITLTGDEDGCKAYLGEVNRALYELRRMYKGMAVPFFALPERKFADGTIIKVWTSDGRDYASIFKPIVKKAEEESFEVETFFPAYLVDGGCVRASWKTLEPIEFIANKYFRYCADLPDNCTKDIWVETFPYPLGIDETASARIIDEDGREYRTGGLNQEYSVVYSSIEVPPYPDGSAGITHYQGLMSRSSISSGLFGQYISNYAAFEAGGIRYCPIGNPERASWREVYAYADGTYQLSSSWEFEGLSFPLVDYYRERFSGDGVLSRNVQTVVQNRTESLGGVYSQTGALNYHYYDMLPNGAGAIYPPDHSATESRVSSGEYVPVPSIVPYKLYFGVKDIFDPYILGNAITRVFTRDGLYKERLYEENHPFLYPFKTAVCIFARSNHVTDSVNTETSHSTPSSYPSVFHFHTEYNPSKVTGYTEYYRLLNPMNNQIVSREFVSGIEGCSIMGHESYCELFVAYKTAKQPE